MSFNYLDDNIREKHTRNKFALLKKIIINKL